MMVNIRCLSGQDSSVRKKVTTMESGAKLGFHVLSTSLHSIGHHFITVL